MLHEHWSRLVNQCKVVCIHSIEIYLELLIEFSGNSHKTLYILRLLE